jgi:hypothetical protein
MMLPMVDSGDERSAGECTDDHAVWSLLPNSYFIVKQLVAIWRHQGQQDLP